MKTKKTILLIALVVIMLFSGCTAKSETSPTNTEDTETSQ
jgi:PBP1b-binding outer membrane lipoprotein LpoB